MSRIPREPRIGVDVKDSKPGADVPTVVRLDNSAIRPATHCILDRQRGETPWPKTILHRPPAGKPKSWDCRRGIGERVDRRDAAFI